MDKKEKQWYIDRAINFTLENEKRIEKILRYISKVMANELSINEFLEEITKEGLVSSPERYGRSFQTFLKSHGLIVNTYQLSEVSLMYLDKKLSFQELILLQAFKKQYFRNESYPIRPLMITLLVLTEIEKNEEKLAWIDVYDYMNYLTEIQCYEDIPNFVEKIIQDKKDSVSREIIYKREDFDIWSNMFVTLGVLKENNKKFILNHDNSVLIDYLIKNHEKAPLIGNDDDWLLEYGNFSKGILDILPEIKLGSSYEISNLKTEFHKILYDFYFKGYGRREIDRDIFSRNGQFESNGWISQHILKSFGVLDEDKGVLEPFINFKGILKNSDIYENLGVVFNLLFNEERELKSIYYDYSRNIKGGENLIFYGNPGCGKSFYVKNSYLKEYKEANLDSDVIRTTFYPEYSNADFIGQIIPSISNRKGEPIAEYVFVPGPFTQALKKAINNPKKHVYLIIEEINRGDASSIFGDIFQLLDREEDINEAKFGFSTYPINNINIQKYLKEETKYEFENIFLPSNLSLIATMNTSDQNIYTLDNAFKRRWNSVHISNTFKDSEFPKLYIPGTNIKWSEFVKEINKAILKENAGFSREDKQIGCYSISKKLLTDAPNIDKEKFISFANNMFEYIWNDIAKLNTDEWFRNPNTKKAFVSFDNLMDFVESCYSELQEDFNKILEVINDEKVNFKND